MSCLGVIFAVLPEVKDKLLTAQGDHQVLEVVKEIESPWDISWLCDLDKAWDGIHRALTDGQLDFTNGEFPLNHAVMGGRRLYFGDDYIVSYATNSQVKEIANAVSGINEEAFRMGYGLIEPYISDYPFYGDEDFDYCYEYFSQLQKFYAKAAEHNRATIFTADQ